MSVALRKINRQDAAYWAGEDESHWFLRIPK